MKDDDMNILKNLSPEEYKEFRSLVITMVLATDMSHHFQQINTIKGTILKQYANHGSDETVGLGGTSKRLDRTSERLGGTSKRLGGTPGGKGEVD